MSGKGKEPSFPRRSGGPTAPFAGARHLTPRSYFESTVEEWNLEKTPERLKDVVQAWELWRPFREKKEVV